MLPKRLFKIVFVFFCLLDSQLAADTVTTITYLPGPMILSEDIISKNPDANITSIEVEGLNRISATTLTAVIDVHSEEPLGTLNLNQARRRLLRTNMFESVRFYYQLIPEGYKIIIKVNERSYVDLKPYFSLSSGAIITGGARINSEIQGSTSELLATTVWQHGGLTGKLGYINPELYDGNGTFSLFFSGGYEEQHHSYTDGTELRTFSGYSGDLSSQLAFNQNRNFQPGFSLEYEMLDLYSSWDPHYELADSSEMLGVGARLTYDTTYFVYYFREGTIISLNLSRGFIIGPRTGNLYGSLSAEKTVRNIFRHNLSMFAKAGFNFTDPLHYNKLYGPGFRVLPMKNTVDRLYSSAGVEYEVPLAQPSFGTFTTFSFIETGYYSPVEDSHELFFGPGLGFRFYAHRVEAPVFGFHAGLNTLTRTVQSEFFIGIQF
ncbi:MAG: hypothetical protein U5P10_14250 [Spirochaetia bacterium]|nr:hypothetical protein [Spirochaetia bacterium]